MKISPTNARSLRIGILTAQRDSAIALAYAMSPTPENADRLLKAFEQLTALPDKLAMKAYTREINSQTAKLEKKTAVIKAKLGNLKAEPQPLIRSGFHDRSTDGH